MGDRVAFIKDGKFGTIGAEFAHEVERGGGRILTPKQAAEEQSSLEQQAASDAADARYAAKPLGQKIAGALPLAAGAINPLLLGGATDSAPPVAASAGAGIREGLTAGTSDLGEAKLAKAMGGESAQRRVVENQDLTNASNPIAHGAGNVLGLVAGSALGEAPAPGASAGAGALLPSGAIARGGVLAEHLAGAGGKLLGLGEESGVLGKAALGAAKVGARGAFEGAAYSGIEEANRQALHDPEMSGAKIMAAVGIGGLLGGGLGAAIGGGSSLAGSGLRAAFAKEAAAAAPEALTEVPKLRSLDSGLSSAGEEGASPFNFSGEVPVRGEPMPNASAPLYRAEQEASEGPLKMGKQVSFNPDAGFATAPEATVSPIAIPPAQNAVGAVTAGGPGDLAAKLAAKSLSYGGLQPTKFVARAKKNLPGGDVTIGKWLFKNGIRDADQGLVHAFTDASPTKTLENIEAAHEIGTTKLVDFTNAQNVKVNPKELHSAMDAVVNKWKATVATEPIGNAIEAFADRIKAKLGDDIPVGDLLRERKGVDQLAFANQTLDPSLQIEVKRDLRSALEGVVENTIDSNSGKATGEKLAEYKNLKLDFMTGKLALEQAEDSLARHQKNSIFGVSSMAAGLAAAVAGHGIAAPVVAIGMKYAKERGAGVAAVALSKLSKTNVLAKMVATVDTKVDGAARGLLNKPAKRLMEVPEGSPQQRATTIMRRIAELQANPEAVADHVANETSDISESHPEIADAVGQNMTRAITFLASKVPVDMDRDPLNPHETPKLTDADAAELARYGWYAEKPDRFFDDMKHGKLTYEGAETAQELLGPLFTELQTRTADAMATHLARGRAIPYEQKVKIGDVLGFAAVPEQRPDLMQRLQQNAVNSTQQTQAMNGGGKRSAPIPTQNSVYDRLEGGGKHAR